MPASRFRSGARKAGFIPTIRGAGFSGTAAITWGGASPRRMRARLNAGRPSGGTSHRSDGTASPATRGAGRVSAKRYCTGPTTVARFETKVSARLRGPVDPCCVAPRRGEMDMQVLRFRVRELALYRRFDVGALDDLPARHHSR